LLDSGGSVKNGWETPFAKPVTNDLPSRGKDQKEMKVHLTSPSPAERTKIPPQDAGER